MSSPMYIEQRHYTEPHCKGSEQFISLYDIVDRCIKYYTWRDRYYHAECLPDGTPRVYACSDSSCHHNNCTLLVYRSGCFMQDFWKCSDGKDFNATSTKYAYYRFDNTDCQGKPFYHEKYLDHCSNFMSRQMEPYSKRISCDKTKGVKLNQWDNVHDCPSSQPTHQTSMPEGCNHGEYGYGCLKPDPFQ